MTNLDAFLDEMMAKTAPLHLRHNAELRERLRRIVLELGRQVDPDDAERAGIECSKANVTRLVLLQRRVDEMLKPRRVAVCKWNRIHPSNVLAKDVHSDASSVVRNGATDEARWMSPAFFRLRTESLLIRYD